MNNENAGEEFRSRYWHPAVTTDCVIFGYDSYQCKLKLLLIRRGIEPFKDQWALPGGFVRKDESCEDGAKRELKEETKLDQATIRQFGCFSAVNRDPRERVITIAFYALVKMQDVLGSDDAAEAKWFDIKDMPKPLAFDHDEIVKCALEAMRRDMHFEPIGADLLPEKFSMNSMQQLYQQLLGVEFDRRNFHNKMKKTGILRPLNEKSPIARTRHADLYAFDMDKYNEFKNNGIRMEFEGIIKKNSSTN